MNFTPPISRLIEEAFWYESQRIENLENGTLLFTVEVEGTWEIKKRILGFGKYAEVMMPANHREEIRDKFVEMMGIYRS